MKEMTSKPKLTRLILFSGSGHPWHAPSLWRFWRNRNERLSTDIEKFTKGVLYFGDTDDIPWNKIIFTQNIKNVTRCRDSRSAKSIETR